MFGFQLGREFKLSIAEVLAVFEDIKIIDHSMQVLIVESKSGEDEKLKEEILKKADSLGGSIKIMEINDLGTQPFEDSIFEKGEFHEGKFQYGITFFGDKMNLKTLLMTIKKRFRAEKISSRFVNKDFKSLSSAQIIGEQLVRRGTDYSLILINGKHYFGTTFWVQDIYAYSKRDYAKSRDMQVGMLPPKLSQMMINLASAYSINKNSIYDPFVGLGTILIEADLMGFENLYGSDLNEKMVETSSANVSKATIEKLNAKFVYEASFWNEVKNGIIVSEGFLGEVMTQKNISKERINDQKDSLLKLYSAFFENLKKGGFTGTLVITFPFWEIRGKYFYFEEVYKIIEQYCDILPYFPENLDIKATKSGSLLYKREKQLVGREMFRLEIKS
ncbi:hypothetical protein LR004_00175 [Candidatus Gracilibacteria bacterium]|nr:hypothetical protein [Candidatus Gracilibacteria bacterium]